MHVVSIIHNTIIGSSLKIKSNIDSLIFLQTNVNSIYILQITSCEVEHIISNMKISMTGYEELPSSIMKYCIETYLEPLTFLINITIKYIGRILLDILISIPYQYHIYM